MIALLILVVGICFIILFAGQGTLRDRITRLEEEIEQLKAGIVGSRPPHIDDELLRREEFAASLRPPAEGAVEPTPPPPQLWPEPEPPIEEPSPEPSGPRESFGSLFERFVAGRLLVWVGGAALIGAAILLIKHSIEIGLLTPQARMIGAAVFGFVLVIVGEASPRIRWLSDDPRVRQALVGAGIVTLYATPYGSHVLYGLIDARTAAAAMFLVSAAALVLALRHGAPTAVMGLVGAFLTPALVGDPSSSAVPLLVYLTLVNGAVFGIAWRRGWTWLAAASVAFSFLWTFYLLGRPPGDAHAVGFFVIVLSLAGALVRPGKGRELVVLQPLIVGLIQLSVLVGRADLGPAAWAMFGALAATAVALSLLRAEHRFAPAAALALTLLLILAEAPDRDPLVPWAAAAATLLFAGVSIPLAPRGDRLLRTATAAAALVGPFAILRLSWPNLLQIYGWGLVAIGLAAFALLLAWLQRGESRHETRADDGLLIAAGTAAALLGAAVYDLLPRELLPAGWLAAALALALFGRPIRDTAFTAAAFVLATLAVFESVRQVPELWSTVVLSLAGEPALASHLPEPRAALVVLLLPAALLIALAQLLEGPPRLRRLALSAAAVFAVGAAYVLWKQVFALDDGRFERWGFAERTVLTQLLFLAGWLLTSGRLRLGRFDAGRAARIGGMLTLVAALRFVWFDMLLHNPLFDRQWVGTVPVANLLLPAYFLSAVWLYEARRRADAETRSGFWLVAFLGALVLWVMLTVRQSFHGPWLEAWREWPRAEVYMYSLAGLLLSAALIVGGIRLKDKAVRLAGLVLLTATVVKVFWSDAAVLEGILRILSFFGLGVGLIAVALLYNPVLRAESGARDQQ